MASAEVLVAFHQAFKVALARHPFKLSAGTTVARNARKDEVPNAIDVPSFKAPIVEALGKEVIYVRCIWTRGFN